MENMHQAPHVKLRAKMNMRPLKLAFALVGQFAAKNNLAEPVFVMYPRQGINSGFGQFFDIHGKIIPLPSNPSPETVDIAALTEASFIVESEFDDRDYPVQFRRFRDGSIEWGIFREIHAHATGFAPESEPDYPALAGSPEEEENLRSYLKNHNQNRRGPKPKWYKEISAPPQALELYRLLSELALDADAFAECHEYSGAFNNRIATPVITYKNEIHRLPRFVAAFMGLPNSKKQCKNPRCMNPFHYIPLEEKQLGLARRQILANPIVDVATAEASKLDGLLDMLDYYIRDVEIPANYEKLRSHIPPEDISDEDLTLALAEWKGRATAL